MQRRELVSILSIDLPSRIEKRPYSEWAAPDRRRMERRE
jgi:hypothetical protein